MDKKANCNYIRAARKKRDLTQKELAEMIGVPSEYISKMERGVLGVTSDNYLRISIALGVSVDYLMTGKMLYTCNNSLNDLTAAMNRIIEKGAKDDLIDLLSAIINCLG